MYFKESPKPPNNPFQSIINGEPWEHFMAELNKDRCGKCGADIDPTRRVDFTLKDGTRVCDSCFVKGTKRPSEPAEKSF
jgi:hypothetical protein